QSYTIRSQRHIRRILIAPLVAIYLLVALVNEQWIQTFLGSCASAYFTKEWGGKVDIAMLHVNLLGGVDLYGVELIDPKGDTILSSGRIGVTFWGNPISDEGLSVGRVLLQDTYYHLNIDATTGINLKYIIRYFASQSSDDSDESPSKPFVIKAKQLVLDNVEYKMDLKDPLHKPFPEHGVCYKHMHFTHIKARIKDIHVIKNNIACRIVHFDATEQSGFHMTDLSCDVKVSPSMISARNMELSTASGTHLLLDAMLQYNHWMHDYTDSVYHSLHIREGSVASLQDAAYWAPVLWGADQQVTLSGDAYGPISNLTTNHFSVNLADLAQFVVDGNVTGLPNIRHTIFDATVSQLQTSYNDLTQIHCPGFIRFHLPSILARLGELDITASLHGGFDQCEASANINTQRGVVQASASSHFDNNSQQYIHHAELQSPQFSISSILPNDWVSHSGLQLTADATSAPGQPLKASLSGQLFSTILRGVPIQPTLISASLDNNNISAEATFTDPLADAHINASVAKPDSNTQISVDAKINNLDLRALHFITTDQKTALRTRLRANFNGQSIEDLQGSLSLNRSDITLGNYTTTLHNALLTINTYANIKQLNFVSDWANISAYGDFKYSQIPQLASLFAKQYIPQYFTSDVTHETSDLPQKINITARWDGDYTTLHSIGLPLSIAPRSSFQFSYSASQPFHLVARSDSIAYNQFRFYGIGAIGQPSNESYHTQVQIDQTRTGPLLLMSNLNININTAPTNSTITLQSDDNASLSNINIISTWVSSPQSNHFYITQGQFEALNQQWSIYSPETIIQSTSLFHVGNIKIFNQDQWATFSIHKDPDHETSAKMQFNDFSLSWISEFFPTGGLMFEGDIDGFVEMYQQDQTPNFTANLTVDNCVIEDYLLGHLSLKSQWQQQSNMILLDISSLTQRESGSFQPISAHGTIDLNQQSTLDINADFDQFPLEIMTPFLSSFASLFQGSLHGHVHAGGTIASPMIQGQAVVSNGLLTIAPTQVSYQFSDTLTLTNHNISLHQFNIYDPAGNCLSVSGNIYYEDFTHANLNLSAQAPKLMLLNIPQQIDKISGTLLTSIQGQLSGPSNQLKLTIAAQTMPGSKLCIPVNDQQQTATSSYITFVGGQQATTTTSFAPSSMPVNMQIQLTLTPDMKFELPMDFGQLSANLQAAGQGNMELRMQPYSQPLITGNYELTSGQVQLDFLSFLSTSFTIDAGSSLQMPGNINNATFNIQASRTTHANMASLLGSESAARSVNVENVIILSGNLQNPHVALDFRLPNAEKGLEDEIAMYIDRTDEREVFTQSMSLLLTGQFAPTASSQNSTSLDNASASGYNLMASSLGAMVSNVVKVVDIDFGYQAANELTNQQFDVDIRKNWNRFYFESTLGYGGESRTLSSSTNNNTLVGDVLVGYRLNPYLHFFVFNRTNTNDYTRSALPYKQGFGLKLTREFDVFGKRKAKIAESKDQK
ncbi:MAG: translocation/assembly module TamB domain-containing protein, partial [Bacteroidales bacterium]|nr:translocation/assembly module TamB domain-containing protein [Candidatus Colimorpha onthohippi]